MSGAQQPANPHEILNKLLKKLSVRILIVVLALALVIWLFYPAAAPQQPPPQDPGTKQTGPAPAPAADQVEKAQARAEVVTASSVSAGTRAAAKVRQEQFLAEVDEARAVIDTASRAVAEFTRTVEALLTDDRGKALAEDEDLLGRFRAITEAERAPAERLKKLSGQLDTLAAPVKKAAANPDDVMKPAPELSQLTAKIRAEAAGVNGDYRRALAELEALARLAQTSRKPGASTLKDAVARHTDKEALAAASRVREERARAKKEADEKRAKAEGDAVRIAGDVEAKKILDAAARKKAEADAEERAFRAKAEQARLRKKIKDPEVERYLGAFLAKGVMQPKEVQGTFLAFERTATAEPISYSRLQTLGALDDGIKGLVMLNWIADGQAQNDRPRWRFGHQSSWTPGGQQFIKKAQELLIELGPTLVEEGLLAK